MISDYQLYMHGILYSTFVNSPLDLVVKDICTQISNIMHN